MFSKDLQSLPNEQPFLKTGDLVCVDIGFLFCFVLFNSSSIQNFSLDMRLSLREREIKNIEVFLFFLSLSLSLSARRKPSKQPTFAPTAMTVGPCPTTLINRMPRNRKLPGTIVCTATIAQKNTYLRVYRG